MGTEADVFCLLENDMGIEGMIWIFVMTITDSIFQLMSEQVVELLFVLKISTVFNLDKNIHLQYSESKAQNCLPSLPNPHNHYCEVQTRNPVPKTAREEIV